MENARLRTTAEAPFLEEGAAFARLHSLSTRSTGREVFDVVVIGGGQAGLSVGYHLAGHGLRFVILDASARVGDSWRHRWDSLRLFTPARYDGLDGMPFPGATWSFPTKDEMGDYLESYARRFELPVRSSVRVDRLSREGDRYLVEAGTRDFEAPNVVVAMANYQRPKVPAFASELRPEIVQLHSGEYRNPSQLQEGDVLLVGAGNSGSEIAMELSPSHRVLMSGRDTGHLPFRVEGLAGRLLLVPLVLKGLFHRVLTVRTPLGRRVRPRILGQGGPLIRVKPRDLATAGVVRLPKTAGVSHGWPRLEGGRALDTVKNVVWCTGFHPGFSWVDLPAFDAAGRPRHESGRVPSEPGLYFVGLHFLHALSSAMIHGVSRDAARVARQIALRQGRGVTPGVAGTVSSA